MLTTDGCYSMNRGQNLRLAFTKHNRAWNEDLKQQLSVDLGLTDGRVHDHGISYAGYNEMAKLGLTVAVMDVHRMVQYFLFMNETFLTDRGKLQEQWALVNSKIPDRLGDTI